MYVTSLTSQPTFPALLPFVFQGEIPEGYFQEGEAVVYHSRTQGACLVG